jgi:hypothetical protein
MVWVLIALAIPLTGLLLLHLLRFHFTIDVETPAILRGSIGVSFLAFRREVVVDAAQAIRGRGSDGEDEDDDDGDGGDGGKGGNNSGGMGGDKAATPGTSARGPESSGASGIGTGQQGALRIPDRWVRFTGRLQARFHKAMTKWVLDPGVWRIALRFSWKSGRRVVGLIHPAINYLHLCLEDVFALGRISAAWVVAQGMFPALTCPTEFGFARPFSLRARLSGGFTGLNLLVFGLLTLFTFPWRPLTARFLECWRDPRLTRWQRRVLLP